MDTKEDDVYLEFLASFRGMQATLADFEGRFSKCHIHKVFFIEFAIYASVFVFFYLCQQVLSVVHMIV